MANFQLHEIEMLQKQYKAGIKEQEGMIESHQAAIVDIQRAIREQKERESYAVGDGVKKTIADHYVQIQGLEAAQANAQRKISEYQGFIQRLDAEAAQLHTAADTVSKRLEAQQNENSTHF
jgi:chromosome segregation ATPase